MFLEVDWSRRKRLSQLLEGKRTIWSKGGAPFTQKRVFGLMAPEEVTWIFMQSNPHRIVSLKSAVMKTMLATITR